MCQVINALFTLLWINTKYYIYFKPTFNDNKKVIINIIIIFVLSLLTPTTLFCLIDLSFVQQYSRETGQRDFLYTDSVDIQFSFKRIIHLTQIRSQPVPTHTRPPPYAPQRKKKPARKMDGVLLTTEPVVTLTRLFLQVVLYSVCPGLFEQCGASFFIF